MKDLTEFLTPDLVLVWKDQTFIVPPPSKEDGLTMAALNVAGISAYTATQDACQVCGRTGAVELDDKTRSRIALAKDRDLGELSLGPAYQQMQDAGVAGPDLEMFELYAFYYWVLGEATADQIISARAQSKTDGEGPGPKDQ